MSAILQIIVLSVVVWLGLKIVGKLIKFYLAFRAISEPLRQFKAAAKQAQAQAQQQQKRKTSHNDKNMVQCEICQLYIPESEAIISQGKQFCCHAHAKEFKS